MRYTNLSPNTASAANLLRCFAPPQVAEKHTVKRPDHRPSPMKHRLSMQLISRPEWAQRHETRFYNGFPLSAYEALQCEREALDQLVHEALQGYVDDPELVFDGDKEFPALGALTGAYYVASESYDVASVGLDGAYRVSVQTHCLEEGETDYLGLEVHLTVRRSDLSIRFLGDIDSSAI